VLVAGKGGVGKSTCAAAIALVLAETRPVTLLGTDPARALSDVLVLPLPSGSTDATASLRVRQIRPDEEGSTFGSRYRSEIDAALAAIGLDHAARLDRRVLEALGDLAPPGLDEIVAVAALVDDLASGRTVVVDTAPTGHFLRLIETPE